MLEGNKNPLCWEVAVGLVKKVAGCGNVGARDARDAKGRGINVSLGLEPGRCSEEHLVLFRKSPPPANNRVSLTSMDVSELWDSGELIDGDVEFLYSSSPSRRRSSLVRPCNV